MDLVLRVVSGGPPSGLSGLTTVLDQAGVSLLQAPPSVTIGRRTMPGTASVTSRSVPWIPPSGPERTSSTWPRRSSHSRRRSCRPPCRYATPSRARRVRAQPARSRSTCRRSPGSTISRTKSPGGCGEVAEYSRLGRHPALARSTAQSCASPAATVCDRCKVGVTTPPRKGRMSGAEKSATCRRL